MKNVLLWSLSLTYTHTRKVSVVLPLDSCTIITSTQHSNGNLPHHSFQWTSALCMCACNISTHWKTHTHTQLIVQTMVPVSWHNHNDIIMISSRLFWKGIAGILTDWAGLLTVFYLIIPSTIISRCLPFTVMLTLKGQYTFSSTVQKCWTKPTLSLKLLQQIHLQEI